MRSNDSSKKQERERKNTILLNDFGSSSAILPIRNVSSIFLNKCLHCWLLLFITGMNRIN